MIAMLFIRHAAAGKPQINAVAQFLLFRSLQMLGKKGNATPRKDAHRQTPGQN